MIQYIFFKSLENPICCYQNKLKSLQAAKSKDEGETGHGSIKRASISNKYFQVLVNPLGSDFSSFSLFQI